MELTNRQCTMLKGCIGGGSAGLLAFMFQLIKISLIVKIYLIVIVLVLVGLINTMIYFLFEW